MPTITVEGEKPFDVSPGTKLVLGIEDAGIDILHRCGGQARCTTCRVKFREGEPPEIGAAERTTLEEDGLLGEYRLSCQVRVEDQDMTVQVWGRANEKGIPPETAPKIRGREPIVPNESPSRRVGLLYDPVVLEHEPPPGHPERSARVRDTFALLEKSGILERLIRLPVVSAIRTQIERSHAPRYLDAVEAIAAQGGGYLDTGDTVASSGSWRAATAAAGSAISAVDAVMSNQCEAAFALVRPPGHHATPSGAMGFCLLNNAAIAAAHALETHGLSRVLVVDFDVHHGNGTQDAFYADPRVMYFSIHQYPAYPGTGALTETGIGAGQGYTVNVPLPPDVGDSGFLKAFDTILWPLAERFRPELVIVSAGYDAHWRNSAYVSGIRERMTVAGLAPSQPDCRNSDAYCPGRLVGILEGGYDLEALAFGVLGTLRVWLGDEEVEDPIGLPPDVRADPSLAALLTRILQTHQL